MTSVARQTARDAGGGDPSRHPALAPYLPSGSRAERRYSDLREHLAALSDAALLHVIDEPVDKDTEMHPLVRWQFRGGIPEEQRKAFLFTQPTDGKGRRFQGPVLI